MEYTKKIGGRIVSIALSFVLIFGSIDLHVFAEELMSEEVMQTEIEITEEENSLSEEENSEEEVSEETVSEEISEESTEEKMTSEEETASEEEGGDENTEESASEEEKETEEGMTEEIIEEITEESTSIEIELIYIEEIEALDEKARVIYIENKIVLEELLNLFPKNLIGYLEEKEKIEIPVSWECEVDYEGVEQDEYDFYPVLEEGKYELLEEAEKQAENEMIKVILRNEEKCLSNSLLEYDKVWRRKLSLGASHNIVIGQGGKVFAWGINLSGELGDGSTLSRGKPQKIDDLDHVVSIAAGDYYSAAVDSRGNLYMWGRNDSGQLGDGTIIDRYIPQKVQGLKNVVMVSLGNKHSAALTLEGDLYTWGDNTYGQLGNGTTNGCNVPQKILGLENVAFICLGDDSSAAITFDGSVYMWGKNTYGHLGNGTFEDSSVPQKIESLKNIRKISVGDVGCMALDTEGAVYEWGQMELWTSDNGNGCINSPQKVEGLTDITEISVNGSKAAIAQDGSLYTWGYNGCGQLGNGKMGLLEYEKKPQKVRGIERVSAVSMGYQSVAAITEDGGLYEWGENLQDRGDGLTDSICRKYPVKIMDGMFDNIPNYDDIFNMSKYRADRLVTYGNIEEEILSDNISRVTPSDIFATELQKNGFDDRVGAWENVSLLFDMADDIGALYDFSIKEQDIYGAIILEALEISTNYGLSDKWNSLLNVKQAEFYTKCKEFARLKYGIDIGVENNFASLTFEQRDELDKLTDAFFTADYVESDGTLKLIDQVSKNIGKIGKEINSLEAYAERMTNSFL